LLVGVALGTVSRSSATRWLPDDRLLTCGECWERRDRHQLRWSRSKLLIPLEDQLVQHWPVCSGACGPPRADSERGLPLVRCRRPVGKEDASRRARAHRARPRRGGRSLRSGRLARMSEAGRASQLDLRQLLHGYMDGVAAASRIHNQRKAHLDW